MSSDIELVQKKKKYTSKVKDKLLHLALAKKERHNTECASVNCGGSIIRILVYFSPLPIASFEWSSEQKKALCRVQAVAHTALPLGPSPADPVETESAVTAPWSL